MRNAECGAKEAAPCANHSGSSESCGSACSAVSPSQPISLEAALSRFDREARPGVCDTGRYRCSYFSWGDGPPLVMIPGLGSDARAYIPLAAHLSSHFRCILYDLPTGRGDAAHLRRYDLDALSADVLALLDHLGEREATVIGWSFGSMIALHTMAQSPDRAKRAVLLGGFARRRLAPAEVLLARLLRHIHAPMRRLPFHDRLMDYSHHEPFLKQPPEVWEFFLQRCGATSIAVVAQRALLLHATDLRPELPKIQGPVLLVTGELDPLVPRSASLELHQGLPKPTHVELGGCGHFAALSHTASLADIISHFLRPCPSENGDQPCTSAQPCAAAMNDASSKRR
jgi:pimeloyl-ACP methyl ester carboxylesterase